MGKILENKFFDAFKFGGVVGLCIDWISYKYDLPRMMKSRRERKPTGEEEAFYESVHDKVMVSAPGIMKASSVDETALMAEIDGNMGECSNEAELKRYLYSLLMPFGDSCSGYSSTFCPLADIALNQNRIDELERQASASAAAGDSSQEEACREKISEIKEQISYTREREATFADIITVNSREYEGSVEYYLSRFDSMAIRYSNRLDALLLTHGIDLLQFQEECGIYLKSTREISDIDIYIGSKELTQRYLEALRSNVPESVRVDTYGGFPNDKTEFSSSSEVLDIFEIDSIQAEDSSDSSTSSPTIVVFPKELNTIKALKLFEVAISYGLIDNEYNWINTKYLMAYFAYKASEYLKLGKGMFERNGQLHTKVSWKPFEILFHTNSLAMAFRDCTRSTGVPIGHEAVDEVFKSDHLL